MTQWEGASVGVYQLERRLGGGGAGEVYVASGPSAPEAANGQVAVKVSRASAQTPLGQEMLRQMRVAKELHDPHIVPILDVTSQDQSLLLVMGYAPGGSLGDALRADAGHPVSLPLRVDVVNRLVTQLARTLATAHAAGLVHGDLKPSNIFVRTSPGGAPLAALSDFGQGYLTKPAVETLKRSGQTPALQAVEQLRFAAPEQLDGALLPASDQYALAAIAYFLLTGMYPSRADGPDILQVIAQGAVLPPSQLSPVLNEDVDAVLLRALAKRPEQRFPSIGAFAQAFSAALASSAEAGAPGATQQMQMLRQATAMPRPSASGMSLEQSGAPAGGASARGMVSSTALPQAEPAFSTQRKLAIFVSLALLVALVSCAVATLAFPGTSTQLPLGGSLPSLSGPNSAPTATTPKEQVSAQQAQARLKAAVSKTALFSDALSSNTHGWPVNGKTIFFGSDGRLHLMNNATSPLAADKPSGQVTSGSFVARVTVELLQGFTGDRSGLRFLVQHNGDGTETYYSYTVTSDGRYDLSYFDGSAGLTFLTAGYGAAITPGMQKPNTIAVLVDVQQGVILLFANDRYVAQTRLLLNGPTTGGIGLIAIDSGVEASFSNYAIYPAA